MTQRKQLCGEPVRVALWAIGLRVPKSRRIVPEDFTEEERFRMFKAVLHGQVWRLITFIFIPPNSNILFILFSLYFYWLIGSALENQWGEFRYNIYYLCGMICTVIAGMITFFPSKLSKWKPSSEVIPSCADENASSRHMCILFGSGLL